MWARAIGGLPINTTPNHAQSLNEIVSDLKTDIKQFVRTRLQLLAQELQEKVKVLKAVAPLAAFFALLMGMAYLLLTLALVSLIAMAFQPSPYRWFFAFVIVGVCWAILGFSAGLIAWQKLSADSLLPQKTINVLKADKNWLEDEVKKTNEHSPDPKVGEGGLRAA